MATSKSNQSAVYERKNFSKISGSLALPNLIEVQTESYDWFIKEGIIEAFNDIYPLVTFINSSIFSSSLSILFNLNLFSNIDILYAPLL